jgi:hypothetical protein
MQKGKIGAGVLSSEGKGPVKNMAGLRNAA